MIKWYVNNLHVSTPDEVIIDDFMARCAAAGKTAEETKGVVREALHHHHENQAFYARVMADHG